MYFNVINEENQHVAFHRTVFCYFYKLSEAHLMIDMEIDRMRDLRAKQRNFLIAQNCLQQLARFLIGIAMRGGAQKKAKWRHDAKAATCCLP